ncbi:unnamed protein product [Clonostachys solani]|uniref:Uncharacterized protein n=1 Tax=Clonostachys solani TaxID=160281 RepID=A0A9N9Z613_9HYPO|nr:unnamed protein product [Clonostachys solani]
MPKLPNEILNQVFENARLAEVSFVKLLRVEEAEGELKFSWCGQHVFTEATFPRFDPASLEHGPFEELNEEVSRIRRIEDWWHERRPTKAPPLHPKASLHPKAPLRWTNAAARRISLGDNPVVLPIQMGIPDELEHKEDYFIKPSEFAALRTSQITLNPALDILCLQVGNVFDSFPSENGSKPTVQLSVGHPGTARISNLAVEFHGPTTREWCQSCRDRFGDGANGNPVAFVHNPDDYCRKEVHVPRCKGPCAGCEDVETYNEAVNYHHPVYELLAQFPAVRTLFLIDWAYEPVGAGPDPSTAHASNGDYDFFLVEEGAGKERWRAERPCRFESLYCAESIEEGFVWDQEVTEADLRQDLKFLDDKLDSLKDSGQETNEDRAELEKRARGLTRELDVVAKKAANPLRCQVLAAVKKQRPSA